ncbi:MAG: 1-acyl-sn-glycerol-3-phosphate acyltransferase, partial [Polyangiales bacterium]
MIREGLVRLFRGLAGIYFRDVEVVGCPEAGTRGRLFAANHVNGLIDPILVLTSVPFAIAPIAKEPLFRVPVLKWLLRAVEAVPVVRKKEDANASNEAVFDRIAEHFASGGNVLIFPEGVSHSEPQLVQLRTGPARMLARAKARGTTGLTFQSVALEFDARDTFRSRALVLYGPVRSVDALAEEGDALVRRIHETLRADLADLVVEGRTWPEKLLIARVAQLRAHDAGDSTMHAWSTIGRQVEAARDA